MDLIIHKGVKWYIKHLFSLNIVIEYIDTNDSNLHIESLFKKTNYSRTKLLSSSIKTAQSWWADYTLLEQAGSILPG